VITIPERHTQTDRQTDRRTDNIRSQYRAMHIVHRAVKRTENKLKQCLLGSTNISWLCSEKLRTFAPPHTPSLSPWPAVICRRMHVLKYYLPVTTQLYLRHTDSISFTYSCTETIGWWPHRVFWGGGSLSLALALLGCLLFRQLGMVEV